MTSLLRAIPAMVLSFALAAPALANPAGTGSVGGVDRGGGMFDSGQTIDRIPLSATGQGKRTLLYLWILTSSNAVALATLNAVWQRTENRLPLARIPLLGQLARPDYERADFAPEKQVGTYYYAGKSMLIDLRPAEARAAAPANVEIDWDAIEAKLAAEAKRPAEGQIQIDTKAPAAFVRSVNVFNEELKLFNAGRRPGRARGTRTGAEAVRLPPAAGRQSGAARAGDGEGLRAPHPGLAQHRRAVLELRRRLRG